MAKCPAISCSFFPKFYKRTNLYYTVIILTLCSVSYFIGLYERAAPAAATGDGSSLFRKGTCTTPRTETALDFSRRHRAEGFLPNNATAFSAWSGKRFMPCDVKLSEYTPCEDVERSLKFPRERLIYRERHCPEKHELLKCLVPAPHGYKTPLRWPESRDMVWYANVPHKWLTVEKAGQNWVRFEGDRFTFPGGGTMFPDGADAYIDEIGRLISLKGNSIRTAIDTGCGVASLGAYLLSRGILTMSFAPKVTHEAQVQFALERGVPALIGVLASNRLPYPSRAFDMAHCSRCLVPWGQFDGLYLIEMDRILRPGGYWILSGPPINWKRHWQDWKRTAEDLESEQSAIEEVAKSICWKKLMQKGDLAVWRKPTNHIHCKKTRRVIKKPSFCNGQDPDRAWYTKMEACITPLPEVSDITEIAGGQLARWPEKLTAIPPRIASGSLDGVTSEAFGEDTEKWKKRVSYYKAISNELAQLGRYRNVLDMNAYLGGFAAALVNDPVWVMNIVPVEAKLDTLGVVYERGLIGIYQSWCEAMSTYPRTYDFIHADLVFSLYDNRCDMEDILFEMDRILRPDGCVIFADDVDVLVKVKKKIDGMRWESRLFDHEDGPHRRLKLLLAVKQYWTASSPSQDDS